MTRLWDSAVGLLLCTGGLLGLTPLFGKMAAQGGVPAPAWAFAVSFGAAAVLLGALLARGGAVLLSPHRLRYFVVTAAVSYALPNLLMFSAIPHLGAGYAGIMYTLSPLFTLGLSILAGLRRPSRLGVLGIAVGFVGAVMVALTRGEAGQPAEPLWVLLALLIPVCLAAGNVYRTLDWPKTAGPVELAVGSHGAAAVMLLVGMLVLGEGGTVGRLAEVPVLVLAQAVVGAAMFALFFRLQAVGGPVYLSQIGYVGAAVGLLAGVLALGERYEPLTWAGAAIIAVGVVLTTRAESGAR